MRRDHARDAMPSGSAWNLANLIPDSLQAPLRKRGGWTYVGSALLGANNVYGLCWAPYTAASQLVGLDETGKVWNVLAATSPGTAYIGAQEPFFYRQKVIFPNNDGTTAIKYYDGTTVAALTGSFTGKFGGVFKDHAVLASSSAFPQRLAFSNAADPTTWDLTLEVWDASFPLKGLGFLGSSIILFQEQQTEIIRGSIPPPGGDFVMSQFVQVGCLDAFSIVNWNDQVIWASAEGVFKTDGSSVVNITDRGGMTNYWRDNFLSTYASTFKIVSGVYRDHLIVSLVNASNVYVDTLVCDLTTNVWWRNTNWPMRSAAHVHQVPEELYIGVGARVAKVSTCWSPAAANKNDADGTAVTWTVESAMHRGFMRLHRRWIVSQAIQTWRSLYLDYDMRDAASDAPSIRLSILNDSPESSTYTDASAATGQPPDPLKTTAWTRIRMLINHPSNGLAYRLQSTNASADTLIYGVEAEYEGREGSRVRP